jgi:hypothetical protein
MESIDQVRTKKMTFNKIDSGQGSSQPLALLEEHLLCPGSILIEDYFLRPGSTLMEDYFLRPGSILIEDYFLRPGSTLMEDYFLRPGSMMLEDICQFCLDRVLPGSDDI